MYTDTSKTSIGIVLAVIHQGITQSFQLHSIIYIAEFLGHLKEVQTPIDRHSSI